MRERTRPHHASTRPRALLFALPVGLAVTALGSLCSLAGVAGTAEVSPVEMPVPVIAATLPAIDVEATTVTDPCADSAVRSAIERGDDAATIAAFGGGEAFRAAVVAQNAPCISLSDPRHEWVVVNKARPLDPEAFAPDGLESIDLRATSTSNRMRPAAAQAVEDLGAALADAGAGRLGVNNGYRSYGLQQTTYADHVHAQGQSEADEVSARAGHSEHQTGLSLDVVSCSSRCGGIHSFDGTSESEWIAERAWERGFIVRYQEGRTDVTGYSAEPWHLRYIGPELAAAYHAGGYTTLEEFFGLAPAPDYTT